MKFSTMRYVDETVGTFLVFVLGKVVQLKRLLLPSPSVPEPLEVRNILCQKYFGMGSILHALPLLKALRQHYPNATIYFLTFSSNREVLEICDAGDEILTIDTSTPLTFVRDVFKHLLLLINRRIDICIDLEFYSKFTLLISLLCLAKIRVGLHQKKIRPEGILTKNVHYNCYKHISEIYFSYARALGISYRKEFFDSLLPSMSDESVTQIRHKFSIADNSKVILINVNAGDLFLSRRWPSGHFITLLQKLIDTYPEFCYLLIGNGSDFEYVSDICGQVSHDGQLINAAGKTTIPELFALIQSSDLMITCDSGPLHIAALYGKNLVAFFGPESPQVYGPLNSNALIFYSKDLYCSPCLSIYDSKKCLYGEICPDNICLGNIMPEDVFQAISNKFLAVQAPEE